MDSKNKSPNHLINEKSPYLIQHAYNPVDWHPWGQPALDKAKQEDKPILLSIGYSTCHWCHVMEKESFEDSGIAEIMNEDFICIKVDREERPDLDKLYITAVSAITGSAGWPLNVFLTPDLQPFFGGTYFPPEPRYGVHSWPDLLKLIARAWNDPLHRQKLLASADELTRTLQAHLSSGSNESSKDAVLDPGILFTAFDTLRRSYDRTRGGFSKAPKFPSPSNQHFLFFYHTYGKGGQGGAKQADEALNMAVHTLRAMAKGGIYDHIGGGFHRYSTDDKWHVPHFEKMLYDNAQLIVNYLDAFQLTGDRFFADIVRETVSYVLRDMTHPEGGFYSAEDADSVPSESGAPPESGKVSQKIEGAFYVWTKKAIEALLGRETAGIFSYRYGVKPGGNAEYDPHQEFTGKNILYMAHDIEKTAEKFDKTVEEIDRIIQAARINLLHARAKRPRPHLDDKILTSWNGLMISALAKAYQVLGEERYLHAAVKAAEFIRKNLYNPGSKMLYRRWRKAERKILGMATDYAFLIQGLIDLYEADFNLGRLDWALELIDEQIRLFYDMESGGFFMTRADHDQNLLIRMKEDTDNVLPSAGSTAAINLLRISALSDRQKFLHEAKKTIINVLSQNRQHPSSSLQMLTALGLFLRKPAQVIIAGDRDEKRTQELLNTARSLYLPGKTLILLDGEAAKEKLAERLPFVSFVKPINGVPTAYVCFDRMCKQPVTEPKDLLNLL